MSIANYISFIISPVLIVISILYLKYKFSIRSFGNIRNAILLGMISVIVLLIANYLIELKWDGNYKNMRRMAFFGFIVVAFSSEFAKFIPLKLKFYKLPNFTGPLEGIIYSIFIALGYSTVATIAYAFGLVGIPDKMHNFTLFLYLLPVANIVFGISMGFFTGIAKTRKNTLIDTAVGLGIAVFFHGLFYFGFVTSDIRLLIFIAIGFAVIGITLVVKSVTMKIEERK